MIYQAQATVRNFTTIHAQVWPMAPGANYLKFDVFHASEELIASLKTGKEGTSWAHTSTVYWDLAVEVDELTNVITLKAADGAVILVDSLSPVVADTDNDEDDTDDEDVDDDTDDEE